MSNELTPVSPIEAMLRSLNLPELIAGPAGKAISRLVAGVADIPAAWLNDFAQSIKNKTKAKEIVSTEVATAAAKLAANDSVIVARAAHNLLAKEYRRQKNKEDIARKTIEILEEETATAGPNAPEAKEVDEDWLNVFERYAEDASSVRMQELWARILAGEIRGPRSFSLQTLRFASELDSDTALAFQRYASSIIDYDFIPFPAREGTDFIELLKLEDAGLLTGTTGLLQKKFTGGPGRILFLYKKHAILVEVTKSITVGIPVYLLTRVGREIYSAIEFKDSTENARRFVDQFPKDGVQWIRWVEDSDKAILKPGHSFTARDLETLWVSPPPQPGA